MCSEKGFLRMLCVVKWYNKPIKAYLKHKSNVVLLVNYSAMLRDASLHSCIVML